MRPTCPQCGDRPCAYNYKYKEKVYYRPTCMPCATAKKQAKSPESQALLRSGYQKGKGCDRCGFKAKHPSQLSIAYLDGNRLNATRQNLRTYCANCVAEITVIPPNKSGLVADY